MALSRAEREQFLAEPHVGALSVVERPDRAPLTVPLWYQYIPGGELWVRTLPGSRKMRAIEATGRFSLMVQRTEPTVRYVTVEGPGTRTEPDTPERAWGAGGRFAHESNSTIKPANTAQPSPSSRLTSEPRIPATSSTGSTAVKQYGSIRPNFGRDGPSRGLTAHPPLSLSPWSQYAT